VSPPERPATPTCAARKCSRPSPDSVICGSCLGKFRGELREIPALLVQLEVTFTRQDVHGRDPMVLPPEPAQTKDGPPAATTALQYRPHASDAGRWLHATLDAWTRHLLAALDLTWADAFPPSRWRNERPPWAPFGPLRPPGSSLTGPLRPAGTAPLVPVQGLAAQPWVERAPGVQTVQLARWLDRHPSAVQADPDAGAIVDAVAWATESVRRVVFPRQTHYVGPCECSPCGCEDPKCREPVHGPAVDLYAPAGARRISCSNCGRDYVVTERVAWLREQAEDRLLTAEDMSRALPRLVADIAHRPLTASMIRGYGRRGRIMEYRPDPREWTVEMRPMLDPDTGDELVAADGGPVMVPTPIPPAPWYRVGEVVALMRVLLAEHDEREAARTRKGNASTSEKVAAAQRRFLAALTG
jgi:hypothetical protein